MEFCCNAMRLYFLDPRKPVKYEKGFREYYIKSFIKCKIITFEYCPWCGVKLPESLRDKYFDTLEEECNIDTDILEVGERSDIPDEFLTDEWWKKRRF